MPKVHGGQLVARALKKMGIPCIFTLSGDTISPIYDACLEEGIKIIDVRHEQAAAHMADGWARLTGRPGVAVVTAGPGVANAFPGVANAYHCASPLLVIGGRSRMSRWERGDLQEWAPLGVMGTVTKWARTVYHTRRIPEYVEMALKQALGGRPGPVFIDIPLDVLTQRVEEVEFQFTPLQAPKPQGDPRLVKEAAALLAGASRPLVVAGSGLWWSQASDDLKALVETTGLPVVTVAMGRGCIPDDHPLCLGPFIDGLRTADVILLVGTSPNWKLGFGEPPAVNADAKIIVIDIEPAPIGTVGTVDVHIVGDAQQTLRQLAQAFAFPGSQDPSWVQTLRGEIEAQYRDFQPFLDSPAIPIHPLRLCNEIGIFLDRDAILILDGGDISVWGGKAIKAFLPGHQLDPGNWFCLGAGVPFALAAKIAYPQKQVLLLSGDGSFGINGIEMDTALRHNLPIVAVIANDGAWGMVKHVQEKTFGPERAVGTELGFVRYDQMVTGLGGYGELVENPQNIRHALARAFASGRPSCLNVICDPTVASPMAESLSARLRGEGPPDTLLQ